MTDVNENYMDSLNIVEIIRQAIIDCDRNTIKKHLENLNAPEIAFIIDSIPSADRPKLVEYVPDLINGEVLLHMSDVAAEKLAPFLDNTLWHKFTDEMDTADVAELLEVLPDDTVDNLLESMDSHRRSMIEANLSYPEDTAGRLMHTDTISIRDDVTVETVFRFLRRIDIPNDTDIIMVVNRLGQFKGVVSLVSLVKANSSDLIVSILNDNVQTFSPEDEANQVALVFENYDLITAPVVDVDSKLLGRIVVDDVLDIIREQGEQSMLRQAGLDENEDLFAPIIPSAKRRAVWLAINLVTAFLASYVIGMFQPTLERIVALAVLMPIVASMGGIAGSQTLALAIRGLALGQINSSNIKSLYTKEVGVSVINGLIWSCVVAVISLLWFDSLDLALVIGFALLINVLIASFAGVIVPYLLEKLNIDPAISATVILTTITDVVGFLVFLGLASAVL